MKGYVYKLISKKENDDRFYFGSSNDIERRMLQHKKIPCSKNLKEWFKEVGWENITYVIIVEFDDITKDELLQKEDDEVIKYLNKDPNCLNHKRVVNKRISKNKGQNTRYYNFWRCDLEGKKLQQYKNTKEAGEWIKNYNDKIKGSLKSISHNIAGCLNNNISTAYGFRWIPDNEDLPNEIWKEVDRKHINNVEGIFVSNKGRVKRDNKITYGIKNSQGYMVYSINSIIYKVHRLIALTFLTNPNNKHFTKKIV